MSLLDFLIRQFYENEFMTAAVVAAPMTALVFAARQFPVKLWFLLQRQFTIEVGFTSDLPDYLAVQEFVAANVVSERFSRRFQYAAERRWDRDTGEDKVVHRGLTPGYGVHFGFFRGRPVWLNRATEPNNQTEKFKERLTLTFLTRNRELLRRFTAEVRAHSEQAVDREHVSLFINNGGWWRFASKLPKRAIETVFTSDGETDSLIRHIRGFERRRSWYRERGLPYHTGVLLTGEPGTGKTSLIHAAASELDRSLHYLNLGSVESDQQLTDLVSGGRDWSRTLLLIEDADASGVQMNRDVPVAASNDEGEARKPVTLAALLNLLDGLLTPDGLIVVATSNHPERLDPALLRAGRFDLHLNLGVLDWRAFVAMARLFGEIIDEGDPRRDAFTPAPGAALRALLLEGGTAAVVGQKRAA